MRVLLLLLALSLECKGHDVVAPKPKLLQKGMPVEGLAGHAGDSVVFKFVVPPGTENLVFKTAGGRGDVDLYARRNVYPTSDHYDAASRLGGTKEEIRLTQPEEGLWYVMIDAFSPFSEVRLTASYALKRGTIDVPRCIPGPGVFAGTATVQIKCPTKGAVIRYTTDGAEPSASSPSYSKPLRLASDTRLRVKAFGRNGKTSAEVDTWYDVKPSSTVTPIANGSAMHHLAGTAGSEHLFKLTLPGGEKSLAFTTEGGPGKSEMLVKRGALPTSKSFDQKSDGKGNRASVVIENPASGDWYVVVRGVSHFSGVSLSAFARADGVDLIAWQPALEPYLSEETFSETDCEVQEGMTSPGSHRLLRFNTETRNIGGSDLVMPAPENNPAFEFADCHGHYHFKGFARYRLLDTQGVEVVTGKKVSFCLLDLSRWDPKANGVVRFNCEEQGIQAGWADVYDSGLPGQWIDVSGVPPGTYTLEITMNPDRVIEEANYDNNTATVQVVLE